MKEIELSQGKVALVDDENFEWLNQWKWYASKTGRVENELWYGIRMVCNSGKRRSISMHRVILDAPSGVGVDHINHDGLDNRRANLRFSNQSQNTANSRKQDGCSSRYKGVCWDKQHQKWRAGIMKNYKHIFLGLYSDEVETARAYDEAALEAFGEFASLNGV